MHEFIRKISRHAFFALLLLSLASATFGQLVSQGNEQVVTYSGSTAFILSNSPVNPNLLVNTGTNTFIMNVNPPTNAIRIYVTNDTANACNNLTVSVASTGNSSLNSFNSSVSAWQSITVQSGTGAFVNSQPLTLPASGTVAVTSSPILGSKIAVFVVLSSACVTTTIDLQVVFGTFSAGNPFVQGVVAPGGNATAVNPIIIGGPDASGNNHAVQVNTSPATLGNSLNGLPIGGADVGAGANFTGLRTPAGSQDGPLTVSLFASGISNCGGGATVGCIPLTNPPTGNGGKNGKPGLLVADAGFTTSWTTTFTASGQTLALWQVPVVGAIGGQPIETCHFTVNTSAVTGAAPTMDLYVQDSPEGTTWDDRIHFAQITAPGIQEAGIAGASGNMAVKPRSNLALAASTIVSGPLDSFGQVAAVIGGTTPNFTFTLYANCK